MPFWPGAKTSIPWVHLKEFFLILADNLII
jgi:hypothetical protein